MVQVDFEALSALRRHSCNGAYRRNRPHLRYREGAHCNTFKQVASDPSPARATSLMVRPPLRNISQPTHLALPMIGSMPTRSPMAFAVLDDGLTGRLLVGVAEVALPGGGSHRNAVRATPLHDGHHRDAGNDAGFSLGNGHTECEAD